MADTKGTRPYKSAMDLPTVKELYEQIQAGKLVSRFVGRDQRQNLLAIEAELRRITNTVDRFYELLGSRNWVFHEFLSLERVATFVGDSATPDSAEQGLIDYYCDADVLQSMTRLLWRHEHLRSRLHLIDRARADFFERRYYAATLVLLTVMDGFVSDVDSSRKGLHARGVEEMVGWDSVVAHHMGLSNAHRSFIKSTRATTSSEVFELHRHGILHGTILEYDNVIVAAKAWNRLFAVSDWASSLERMAKPIPPKPTIRETLGKIAESQRTRDYLKRWSPSESVPEDPSFTQQSIYESANSYLEAWKAENYGKMAGFLPKVNQSKTLNSTAGRVRSGYQFHKLEGYKITKLQYVAAAVCEVHVVLTLKGNQESGMMRWVREDDEGRSTVFDSTGRWVIYVWDPFVMLSRAEKL